MIAVDAFPPPLPYPYQGYLLAPRRAAAMQTDRTDPMPLWRGQGVGLVRNDDAGELFGALVK